MTKHVTELLIEDHQRIERLLADFPLGMESPGREDAFCELVFELMAHEVAEMQVVYPVIRERLPHGDSIADERITEEVESELLLQEMEDYGVDDERSDVLFVALRNGMLRHAKEEERTAFNPLAFAAPPSYLQEVGERYEQAKQWDEATHPTPRMRRARLSNKVIGSITALMDKVLDLVSID